MTSEVSEDAERASPANTQAHKTTYVYHPTWKWNGTYFGVFLAPRRRRKKIFFPPKIVSCFFVFFSWSRVARWKEKLTVPLSVPSPLVVLRRAQLTDFYMFPLGTMCEKREGKGSYRWGRICEMLQCDIGGFSPSSVQVVFPPPPSSCPS